MTLSIIIPTLGREEGLKRCMRSIDYPDCETMVIEDTPRMGVPKRLRDGVQLTNGEYICFASNDIEFEPGALAAAIEHSKKTGCGLVAFNTGPLLPDEGNICEHFIIRRDLLPVIGGEIFDTEFHHVGVDNLLWAKCRKLGQATRCEEAKVKHFHFSKGGEMDEVYKLGWSKVEEDRALLKKKLAALEPWRDQIPSHEFQRLELTGYDNSIHMQRYAAVAQDRDLDRTVLLPADQPTQAVFESFVGTVVQSIRTHRYLPVARFGDGEYAFYAGEPIHTCWGEDAKLQNPALHIAALGTISAHGFLCPQLSRLGAWNVENNGLLRFLDVNNIPVSYRPNYFVYALCSHPAFLTELKGKRVAIVTGLANKNRKRLEEKLASFGVSNVELIDIPTTGISNGFDFTAPDRPDIVFVAAGIGAPLVIETLSRLSVPVIDIGGVVNLWDGSLDPHERMFMYYHDPVDREPMFSVVMIAKNEQAALPRLIASLADFKARGGEIVVLDTGSTDKTVEIARAMGCKVEEVGERFMKAIDEGTAEKINARFIVEGEAPIVKGGDRLFQFHEARNYAASLAKNDMVAMPDCDEVYTLIDIDVIDARIRTGVDNFVYNFVYSHFPDGSRMVQFDHSKFYNRKKIRWDGVVHEVLQNLEPARLERVNEDVILLEHFQNHETNRGGYMVGLALDCYENPTKDRQSHYLGRELHWSGRHRSAIKELERHIAMNAWEPERARSMLFLGECSQALGDEVKALSWWTQSFAGFACREPIMKIAEHYQAKNDHARTAAYVAAALSVRKDNRYFVDEKLYGAYPHDMMVWALLPLGRYDEARPHFLRCLELEPTNPRFLAAKKDLFPLLSIKAA